MIMVESPDGFAGEIFDDLADKVSKSPLDPPVKELLQLAHASLSILAALHSNKLGGVCDPRGWTVSKEFKDGHGVHAVAYAPGTDGEPWALFLGLMCRIQKIGQQFHSITCGVTARPPASGLAGGSKRAKRTMEDAMKSIRLATGRTSARRAVAGGYVTLREVREELGGANEGGFRRYPGVPPFKGNLACCGGTSTIKLVQRNDMKVLAKSLIRALRGLGGGGDDSTVEDPELCQYRLLRAIYLQGANTVEFSNKFGVHTEPSIEMGQLVVDFDLNRRMVDSFWERNLSECDPQLRALLDVVCSMHAGKGTAASLLQHRAFGQEGMGDPLCKAHPRGSDSIPQDRVMRAIIYENPQTNTQHFYVAGSKFTGGEESLGVWLVYELKLAEVEPGSPADQETNKSKWYRSLFLGEAGDAGRIVARYKNPIYPDAQLTHMEKCWLLYIPGREMAMDGHCRRRQDAPRMVEAGNVACFANSDRTGTCRREWIPDVKLITADKTVGRPVECCMVLRLKQSADKYAEVTYCYEHEKEETKSNLAVSNVQILSFQWGGSSTGYGGRGGGGGGRGGGGGGRR
jgi:hypothetical protein